MINSRVYALTTRTSQERFTGAGRGVSRVSTLTLAHAGKAPRV